MGEGDVGQVSADGKWFWDGKQWARTLSSDGKWRWDGHAWKSASAPTRTVWASRLRVGAWIAGGLSLLLVLFCMVGLAISISEVTQGDRRAGSTLAGVLIVFSLAI